VKAVVAEELGGSWEVADREAPALGPSDVLVRVLASGVCYTDVHQLRDPRFGMTFPRIPGHEPVGEVIELGSDVTGLAVGDRVGAAYVQRWCGRCRYCERGRYEHCADTSVTGGTVDGGHAELVAMDADSVERVPDGLDAVEAAPIFCAGFTIYSGIVDAGVRPGDKVAVVGVGGLGHLGVQYLAALGAETFAVTRSERKRSELLELGAHHVVVADGGAGRQLAAAGGMDAIINAGNGIDSELLCGLAPYGRLALVGQTRDSLSVTPTDMIFSKTSICGSSQGPRDRLAEVLALHARGGIRTIVEDYSLDDALTAFDRVERGEVRFRAVLVP
jgi:alcohol dehydrogenase